MDAPKSMGETIGTVEAIRRRDRGNMELIIKPVSKGLQLNNGDGFAFVSGSSIVGFRGDVCEGNRIVCKDVDSIRKGVTLFRNIDAAFERALEKNPCRREIRVGLQVNVDSRLNMELIAHTEDGRDFTGTFKGDMERAENRERAEAMLREQLGKRSGIYSFHVIGVDSSAPGGALPLLSASTINSMRRLTAGDLDSIACTGVPMLDVRAGAAPEASTAPGGTPGKPEEEPLMRSRYCIRYELGMCPVHQGAKDSGPLFLLNNGRRLALGFDCRNCEMTVLRTGPTER